MKKLFFLSGLPRSGSTLLSAILNQHKDIYCSPHSGLLAGLWSLNNTFSSLDDVHIAPSPRYENSIKRFPNLFYEDTKQKIVIDKHFLWATPGNIDMAKYVSPDYKMIVLYRPILEILASFVSISEKNNHLAFRRVMEQRDFPPRMYLSINDAIAEYIMNDMDMMMRPLMGLAHVVRLNDSSRFFLLSYDELTKNPEKSLDDICYFLEVGKHVFDANNIKNKNEYYDNFIDMLGLHDVRSKLSKISISPSSVFSDYIIDKYSKTLEAIGLQ